MTWRPFSDNIYKKPWKIVSVFHQLCKDIKWAHQRIWRGYCDYDLYSIDTWFTELMPDMLRTFSNRTHSSPGLCQIEGPKAGTYDTEAHPIDDDAALADWRKILEQMADLCEKMQDRYWDEQGNPYEKDYFAAIDALTVHLDNGGIQYPDLRNYPQYAQLYIDFYDCEKDAKRKQNENKESFFQMFAKYFYDLWD